MKLSGKFSVTFDSCDKEQYMELGDRLRELRSSRGVSQQELGETINRCRTGLSAYERGVKVPTLNGLYEIAEALNYKFNVQFEDKTLELENDIDKIVVFNESYVNNFMERMKKVGTTEYDRVRCMNAENENWRVELLQKDKVNLVSDSGKEIIISTSFYKNEFKSNRFAYVTIYFKVGCSEENPAGGYFVDYYLDMLGEFDLEGMLLLEMLIRELIAAEEIIYGCQMNEELKECFDMDSVRNSSFLANRTLKMEYDLSDDDIVNLIEIMYPEFENPSCLYILNRSKEVNRKSLEVFDIAAFMSSNYMDDNYVNLDTIKEIKKLSDYSKVRDALSLLVHNPHVTNIEYKMTNKEAKGGLCCDILDSKIEDKICECFKTLEKMEDRNEEKSMESVILEMAFAFNPGISMDGLEDQVMEYQEIQI